MEIINKFDIVIVDGEIVQYLDLFGVSGGVVQDIHTKKTIAHSGLIERKATKDEIKWFCENTEHINFIAPKPQDQ